MRSAAALGRQVRSAVPERAAAVNWASIYVTATIIAWTISPLLRRLADWKTHFSAISPFAALPLAMLVPAAAMLFIGRARRINRQFELFALLWLLAFSYALVVAVFVGHVSGGVYTFVAFCLPLAYGLWIATRVEDADWWYRRISLVVIVLAVFTSVYGIVQYVSIAPWDAAWMRSVDMPSIGFPLPFKVRVFSTLNAPATLAAFLTMATVMYLPRLSLRSGILLLPIFIALGLSSVRAAWVTLPVAIVVFAMMTTRRSQLLKGVLAFVGVGVLAIALLQPLFSIGVGVGLQNRLLTLTDVAHDASAGDRAIQMQTALELGLSEPEGNGLGFVGVSTRLNSAEASASVIDSGYLARFVEMGLAGSLAFVVSLLIAFVATFRAWRSAVRNGDGAMQDRAALAAAMQAALASLNVFGDAYTGIAAVLCWICVAFVLRTPAPKRTLV